MAQKVIVQDVQELSRYKAKLSLLVRDLEKCSSDLNKAFEVVQIHVTQMLDLSRSQCKNWCDPQYESLKDSIVRCTAAVNASSVILQSNAEIVSRQLTGIVDSVQYIDKLIDQLLSIAGVTDNSAALASSCAYIKHLSAEEVSARWQSAVESINEQIENYREALYQRGVPDCSWLEKTLTAHKNAMLEQEAYELDVASGHGADSIHNSDAYLYPGDYSAFYDQLAGEFRTHCAEATNPNYNSEEVNQWYINCQRCVPTYEMLRRGLDVTALPCDGGYDYLASHPFSVWENANVISCIGQGKSEIEAAMNSWGDCARAQITVMWTRTSGHTFLAEQRGGRTYFIDPQSGNENYLDWIDSAIPGMTQFCRIDNLDTSPFINHCYREV